MLNSHRIADRLARGTRGAVLCCLLAATPTVAQDPFADAVAAFTPGTNAGFGADELPGIVLGPPHGAGLVEGSLDVVSLGNNGTITMRFDLPVICDGDGPDFTVFENAFHSGSPTGPIFAEYGIVAVSQDGEHFVDFPYDPVTHVGLAGQTPVLSAPDNDIDPLDSAVSGGDVFDLASVGLAWAAYVRISDPGATIPDPGNVIPPGINSGFDLDAIAALHACDPGAVASATPTLTPTPESDTTATPTPSATVVGTIPGDLDGDGVVTAADAALLIAELYDGDGDSVAAAAGGGVASGHAADVNDDGRITAADLTALAARRGK